MGELRFLRKHLNLTQKDMAGILGVTQGAYSAIELGRNELTDRNAEILSNKLGVNKAWLLTGLGDMRSEQKNSSLDKEIIEIQKKPAEEGKAIGGSIPYEFVQALFAERKIHDEIVLSQQKTMESMQQQIKKTSVPGEDVTCAAVSGSDLTK